MMSAATERGAHPRGRAARPLAACTLAIVASLFSASSSAADAASSPAPRATGAAPFAASRPVAREEGIRWAALTPQQREVLTPLERDWPGIDVARKQKWIAIAGRFKSLSPAERDRITARMTEWARLTPDERGQARLRFEEARQVPASDRSARWQAYQALPPEKKQELAARAASAASAPRESRAGAKPGVAKEAKFNVVPNPALTQAPRPIGPTLVQAAPGATTTPITRKPAPPAHQASGMPKIAATPEFVNRSTLLPKRGPQAAAVTPASAPMASAPVPRLPPPAAAPAVPAPPAASAPQ